MYCLKTGNRGINAFYTSYYASQYYGIDLRILAVVKVLAFVSIAVSICWAGKRMRSTFNKTDGSSGGGKSNIVSGRGIAELLGF